MKSKHIALALVGAAGLATAGFMTLPSGKSLIVHEWGTFTSLQGSDGVPVLWKPLETAELPGFVYNWFRPGLRRSPSGLLAFGQKAALVTLQRMETPVIYFYTDRERTVDVTVRFPQGAITEWYPQAEVGPSFTPPNAFVNKVDAGLHDLGLPTNVSTRQLLPDGKISESLIRWSDFKIHPATKTADARLPRDASGSHYFAARETDSANIEVASTSPTNTLPEVEKFLFYRGVANFSAPLFASMPEQDTLSLANLGTNALSHLFLLEIRGDTATLVTLEKLPPGTSTELALDHARSSRPLAAVSKELQHRMQKALVAEGLFPREAKAMVETWKDSWFKEQGVRVLYVLPRAWTDQTLPLTLTPMPQELVRVMVGRAEIVSPEIEQRLVAGFKAERQGQAEAREQLRTIARQLGRFAEPVFDKTLKRMEVKPEDRGRLLALLYQKENR